MDLQEQRETVVGVFPDRPAAERAIVDLKTAGFDDEQIGLLSPHDESGIAVNPVPEYETHAGSGAAAGAVVGGVLGAVIALLIPGIGPVVAGGALAAALGGAAVGVVAGGVVGALVGMGLPEDEARYYEGQFKSGKSLVTVRAGDRWMVARDLLRRNGAFDVHQQQPEPQFPYEGAPPPVGGLAPAETVIPLPPPQPAATPGPARTLQTASPSVPVEAADSGAETMALRPWSEARHTYRNNWQRRFGGTGRRWEEAEPAYRFGHAAAGNPRFAGRPFTSVESDLRGAWETEGYALPWKTVREYVIVVWEELPRAA